jgi:drug/metabolite transporter (DMT)-like permease
MTAIQKAYLQLHTSVLLWGFTAILGKLISISTLPLVWWRLLVTCAGLLFLLRGFKAIQQTPQKVLLQLTGIGIVVVLHWLAFYGSIKYANASVALVCLTTTSLWTAILEPLFFKSKFQVLDLIVAIIIIPAMALIVNHLDVRMLFGVVLGLLCALGAAIFSILNKKMVGKIAPLPMTFVELGSGLCFLTVIMPFFYYYNAGTTFFPTHLDWIYLLFLSIFCTILPFTLSLLALRHLSAFTTVFAVNLEPIYGITMAWYLLEENKELNWQFYLGLAVILAAVFLHPLLKLKIKNTSS